VQKVSYVKGFEPWGWIVGSGVYVDTVDTAIAQRVVRAGLGTLAIAALLLGVSMVIPVG
jgi:methyl-accepting chemotaxis protein